MAKRKEGEILPSYILWPWSSNKAGKHPVKVRVTHQRQRGYYPVFLPDRQKVFLSAKEYEQISTAQLAKLRGTNRVTRLAMESAVQAAGAAIEVATDKGKVAFSFSQFERRYLGADAQKSLLGFFRIHLERMAKKGQAGTVRTYSSAYSALRDFLGGHDIDPAELNSHRLHEFDQWLRESHVVYRDGEKVKIPAKNDTSISIYMRCLRSVYNELAAEDEHLLSTYPFSRSTRDKKYKMPVSSGQKGQTLNAGDLKSFIDGKVDGERTPENPMYRARQLFLFSFFAQGMNFKDMALLRYQNVGRDTIEFDRQKTIRTRRDARTIRIPLSDELKEILIEQGSPDKRKSNFVFGLFVGDHAYSEKEKDDAVRQWIKTTNKWLRRYCEYNDLPIISTYASRHTFASLAKVHLPVAMISQMLGHSRITTTQNYLGRFADDENRQGLSKVFKGIGK